MVGDPPAYFAPLIIALFFVSTLLSGVCFYCCYLRNKQDSERNPATSRARRKLSEEDRNHCPGLYTMNYYSSPYPLYLETIPHEFYRNPPSVLEVGTKNRVAVSCCEETHIRPVGRPNVYRSTSYEQRERLHCRLQVIQEGDEHDETERDEV